MGRPLILLVEDERDLAATCARLLNRLGHAVVTVGTRAGAQARIAAMAPALVVCDIRLPDGSGLDVVRESRPIPAVVMTGQPTERGREEAMAAGACAYLAKPFGVEQFTTVVQRALDDGRAAATRA